MQVAATSLLAVGAEGVHAKVFDSQVESVGEPADEGIAVRFLGTGAADWNGKDERGEHHRDSGSAHDGELHIVEEDAEDKRKYHSRLDDRPDDSVRS